MKHLWLIVVALTMTLGPAAPSRADTDDNPDYTVSCTANAAQWQESINAFNDEAAENAPPTPPGVDVPPGTYTRIFVCPVAGHRVRMNFAQAVPGGAHCGATQDGEISVWIDDVKVVDKRSYGGFANCMANDGKGKEAYRIIVNRLMHLTVCTDPGDGEMPLPTADAANCTLTDVSARLGKGKSDVSTQIVRTPPALVLATDTDPVCRTLDARLQGHMLDDTDPVAAAYSVYSGYAKSNDAQHDTYSLDIDNDGVPDRLDYVFEPDQGSSMGVFSWQRSGKGPAMTIDDSASDFMTWNSRLVGPVDFLRVDGKTYLYIREGTVADGMPVENDTGPEAELGAQPEKVTTRHLLKAKSDGTFTDVCEWAPRQRPEEFL